MGFNTTVLILNDQLDKVDEEFSTQLRRSAASGGLRSSKLPGQHKVLGVHHADYFHVYVVGGNTGVDVGTIPWFVSREKGEMPDMDSEEFKVWVLEQLADRLGYEVKKK